MNKFFVAATATLFLLAGARAYSEQKPIPKTERMGGLLSPSLSPASLLASLDKIALADLQNADAIAIAQGNNINHTCWAALITILQKKQATAADKNGAPVPLPTVHLITDFQNLSDFVNALQPTSNLSVACAPMANAVKMNVLQLITGLVTGQMASAIIIPGL